MSNTKRWVLLVAASLALALILGACGGGEPEQVPVEVTREVEKVVTEQVEVEVTRVVEVVVTEEVPAEPSGDIPFADKWVASAHADIEAEAFRHWDEDDPPLVPATCAKCHAAQGYQDFLGIDGTEAGVVDNDVEPGVIDCVTCHNEATMAMHTVEFPSGVIVTGLEEESRCIQCHQGRASTVQVNQSIEEAGVTDPDAIGEELGFTNIHYFAAAATQYGSIAMGGYQYENKSYDSRFEHVPSFDTCAECHNPHSLQLQLEDCQECHTDIESVEGVRDIRLQGSLVDYDGDGNIQEGIYHEIQGLQEMLYQAIQSYGTNVVGTAIIYDSASYPYFFIDANENGEVDEGEAAYPNRYVTWTPRLAKAAYNYQTSLKDPGQFAHGGKYIIQLLYDSIEDLNQALDEPIDLSNAHRIDAGHFAGSEEAFRHWDEDEPPMVPADCAKCHTASGLPLFVMEGVNISQAPSNGFQCATCHDSLTEWTLYTAESVEFPSGAVIDSGNPTTNLCMNCHQGREGTATVRERLEGMDEDAVSDQLRFLNVHYFAAGATLFGGEAQGAYQYEGKEYVGRLDHPENYDDCVECHSAHALTVKVGGCSMCHQGAETEEDLHTIRAGDTDYDGDGDVEEGIAGEIETVHEMLYEALQGYATEVVGTGIVYAPQSYPYFFVDTNGNGEPDADEVVYANQFNSWTPRLLKAAYNYQYVAKDPGAFAHNGAYILQVLYDSLESLGEQVTVEIADLIRPEAGE